MSRPFMKASDMNSFRRWTLKSQTNLKKSQIYTLKAVVCEPMADVTEAVSIFLSYSLWLRHSQL